MKRSGLIEVKPFLESIGGLENLKQLPESRKDALGGEGGGASKHGRGEHKIAIFLTGMAVFFLRQYAASVGKRLAIRPRRTMRV